MHVRQWPWLPLAALLGLALGGATARAETPRDNKVHHRSTDDDLNPEDIDNAALLQRLNLSEKDAGVSPLLEELLKDPRLKAFSREQVAAGLRKVLDNPELLKRFGPQVQGMKFSNEDRDRLKDLVENKISKLAPSDLKPKDGPGTGPNKPEDIGKPNENNANTGSGRGPDSNQPGSSRRDAEWMRDNLGQLLDALQDAGFDDTEGLRDLLQSLTTGRGLPDGFDMGGSLGRLMQSLPDLGDLLPQHLPELPGLGNLGGVSLPSPPHVSLPSVSGPSWGGGPSLGGASGAAGGLHALLWVAAVVVLGVVLWRVVRNAPPQAARAGRWRLGPWPVAPAHVSTRGELVLAFEYLALKLLGPASRTRHHLDLGDELARCPSFDPVRQHDAAERLARLYEHARYAPPDEALGEDELADARRDLCYLAGVAAA
jgi:hypothetical protein